MDLSTKNMCYMGALAVAAYIIYPTIVPTSSHTRPKKYTQGLLNSGNDCFANSTFQALSSLDTLMEYLEMRLQCYYGALAQTKEDSKTVEDKPTEAVNAGVWMHSLHQFLLSLMAEDLTSSKAVSVWPLLQVMEARYGGRISRAQQDAHEMLVHTIEFLESEAELQKKQLSSLTGDSVTAVDTSAGSITKTSSKTSGSATASISGESLSGNANYFPFSGTTADTITCMKCHFTKTKRTQFQVLERQPSEPILAAQTELISDFRCENCGYVTTIQKTNRVTQIPKILCVHINRSTYSGDSFRNNSAMVVPTTLGKSHELKSIVFHKGNHYRGHYTCARKQRKSHQWWLISDSDVREVSEKSVVSRTKDAYLLFYERR